MTLCLAPVTNAKECQDRGIPAPELLASEVELRKPVFTL
jgi:hypothetical protein